MGGGSWKSSDYLSYASNKGLVSHDTKVNDDGKFDWSAYKTTTKSAAEIFTNHSVSQALDPRKAKLRESRDSKEHPKSHASIFGIDNTGSMGFIAKAIIQESLPKMMQEIYDRKPVTDPQIMFQAINDIDHGGWAQISQFESDIRIAEQLHEFWLQSGGGSNDCESYTLPWYFAAHHCVTDCWEKRKEKGIIYTIGDEKPNAHLTKARLKEQFGEVVAQGHLDTETLLKDVRKKWHVFHVIIEEGSYARSNLNETRSAWNDLLGKEYVISLSDHRQLAEAVVSSMQIAYGDDPDKVLKSWKMDSAALDLLAAATKNIKRIVEV
jgi:hypothetical protein